MNMAPAPDLSSRKVNNYPIHGRTAALKVARRGHSRAFLASVLCVSLTGGRMGKQFFCQSHCSLSCCAPVPPPGGVQPNVHFLGFSDHQLPSLPRELVGVTRYGPSRAVLMPASPFPWVFYEPPCDRRVLGESQTFWRGDPTGEATSPSLPSAKIKSVLNS